MLWEMSAVKARVSCLGVLALALELTLSFHAPQSSWNVQELKETTKQSYPPSYRPFLFHIPLFFISHPLLFLR